MEAKVMSLEEVKKNVHDDDFVFVEFRHGNYNVSEDETFCLRAQIVVHDFIDFSIPGLLMHCMFEDYGKAWRIWTGCPDWDNSEIWE